MSKTSGKSVLVVDDSKTMRDLATAILMKRGFNFVPAEDGSRAQEHLRNGLVPTAILLDINMPGLNGYDICAVIRDQFPSLRCPIVFFTTNRTPEDIAKARNAGGDYYVVKPFTEDSLMTGLKRGFAARQKKLNSA